MHGISSKDLGAKSGICALAVLMKSDIVLVSMLNTPMMSSCSHVELARRRGCLQPTILWESPHLGR